MKKKFSKAWKASRQPRKKRKYLFNAPLHIRHRFLAANLSKDLRKKYSKRSFPLRKGDVVRVMRGSFKKKKGKVVEVNLQRATAYVEGIQISRKDGTKINVPLHASKLQIVELNAEDKKRIKALNRGNKKP